LSCRVCGRRSRALDGSLCKYHREAVDSLGKSYVLWNEAYSGISWKDYLNRVKTLEDTGQWIKEVIAMGVEEPVD
jgi:DNA topoisomerase I